MSVLKRKHAAPTPPELVNQTTDQEFIRQYLQASDDDDSWSRWTHPHTHKRYSLSLVGALRLPPADFDACFNLISHTSKADYEMSPGGWRPRYKRMEMESLELRYLLVREMDQDTTVSNPPQDSIRAGSDRGKVAGFSSMMPVFEDGHAVLYCYEIHLCDELLGTGLGRLLMNHITTAASNMPGISKVTLSCFTSNTRARQFYRKMGFHRDSNSPGPRLLRGKTIEPGYSILSKDVRLKEESKKRKVEIEGRRLDD